MNTRNIFPKSEWDIQEYLPALKCVCRRQQTLRVSLPPIACIRHDEEPGAAPGGESRLHPAGVVALRHRSRQQQRPVVVSLNRCCCCCCSLNVMMLSLSSHSKSRLVSLPQQPFLFFLSFCYYYGASRCRTLQIMCLSWQRPQLLFNRMILSLVGFSAVVSKLLHFSSSLNKQCFFFSVKCISFH